MHMKKKKKKRFPHSPIHLLRRLILTLFILTNCEKYHEIAACIINVWSFPEVLPMITTTTKTQSIPKTTSLFLTKLHPLVTEKVAWHTRNTRIGSFFFRPLPFSWRLNRVQRKNFKLGLATLFNNKICYIVKNKLIIKSYKWNVLCSLISYDSTKLHHKKVCLITVSAILLLYCLHTSGLSAIFESLHFCLELSCKLHVLCKWLHVCPH